MIAVLPGSRKGEVTRHVEPFRQAVARVQEQYPDLVCVIPTVPHLETLLGEMARDWPCRRILVTAEGDRHAAMRAADAALAASGTVSLELALAETPMVIAYRMNPLTHWIVRRMVSIDYASILNIIAVRAGGTPPIPEHLQSDCTPDRLAAELLSLLGEGGKDQIYALKPWLRDLQPPSGSTAGDAAADVILGEIGFRKPE